ncbi:hypothetical protein O181_103757 [Austropuccinia psidii MF-1]|uniref:Uncharacterized protein n=1 Tax=Austropuccinia psidii MF-1 TaxID=1389203 RepID=A0A9Q3JKC6_9BASI|nr:hypothetical protein [Austropuccinia psidii MF-1]
MWKKACDTAARCIAEAKEYHKQRWDKTHMEPDFKEGDQVNPVEVKLTEEFSRKHPVFPVSLVKPYFQTEEDKFPSRKKNPTPPEIVEVEDSPGPVKRIIKARKIRDSTWLHSRTRHLIKTSGWQKMPDQMGTFIYGDS